MERKMKGDVVLINRKGRNRAADVGAVRPYHGQQGGRWTEGRGDHGRKGRAPWERRRESRDDQRGSVGSAPREEAT